MIAVNAEVQKMDDGRWMAQIEHNFSKHYDVAGTSIEAICKVADQVSVECVCEWTQDEDGVYDTACEVRFELNEGAPTENNMRYCHSCGKRIKEVNI
jgi:hypothetical protein